MGNPPHCVALGHSTRSQEGLAPLLSLANTHLMENTSLFKNKTLYKWFSKEYSFVQGDIIWFPVWD